GDSTTSQLTSSIPAPITPPSMSPSTRESRRAGVSMNEHRAATASGVEARKPTSASDGKGTSRPRNTSYQVHTAWPALQARHDRPRRHQAGRTWTARRWAATKQATAAAADVAVSATSSSVEVNDTRETTNGAAIRTVDAARARTVRNDRDRRPPVTLIPPAR